MKTNRLNTRAVLGAYVALAIVAGSLAAACGDDADGDDPNVIPSTGGKSGSGGSGNAAGESSAGAGNEPGTGGSGGSDSGTGTGGAASETGGADGGGGEAGGGTEPGVGGSGGEAGGGGEENCEPQGEYKCYPCAPKTDEQYLNQCSDAECSPFDNADRIPGFTGTLPDL